MAQLAGTGPGNTEAPTLGCARCGRTLRKGWSFAFNAGLATAGTGVAAQLGVAFKCIQCALRHWPMLRRSLIVALTIGTILAFLNHGDTFVSGNWKPGLYWKIPLTYCVPFCVATFGALTNSRR